MSTGTTFKRLKRRFKKKLYHFLVALNDFDFAKLRPLCYLVLIGGILLAWAKLPTIESYNTTDEKTAVASTLATSLRTAVTEQSGQPVDVVALFLPQENINETLYSFDLTGAELSYLAEGAITTVSKENSLY